ncbi:Asp-tRNA(Asn)/Glu-tRNA(Gln) amidotransferase subunit GatB [Candidatus Nitrosotalea bavarica]|uniref:Asp-tRNA(Asn)/Glu-tRNA(Gln) amidotransferase subunit GatB n=1 Tax=Candidatus Nitrosotalea bavarica TaxID=1903277 RepID=UPI000C6FFB29|nr:Asp-tRNA(Asn)/Glu-tRNA(Gln) amidotransferase subunit GatB [Candidatus Nitrosotalea bavarica]
MTRIGLEIHCQLTKLESKLFCSCKAEYRNLAPNSNICPVCAGLPGSLPILNKKAVEKAAMISLALGCTIPQKIGFFRKNYFYPDLPKNFQITQYNAYGPTSIGSDGKITIQGKEINIRRIQLEEDPGRLVYEGKSMLTLVDYNRAGTPLVEIVTEPDFETPKQVRVFLNVLADLVENIGVSDPYLEGAMRVDGNISEGDGNRVEIKNVGSFRDIEKALHFEMTRQQSLLERGIPVVAETRHWDDARRITVSSRSKEEEQDYRYIPEADIPIVLIRNESIETIKKQMPESIVAKRERYVKKYGIPAQVADVLSSDRFYSDLFEKSHNEKNAKEVANIITTDLLSYADTREKKLELKITAQHISSLADSIMDNKLTRNSGKQALQEMVKTGKSLLDVMASLDLGHVSDVNSIEKIIDEVFKEEEKAVTEARRNPDTINYLVGKVMRKTKGKADPATTLDILRKKLSS